MTEPTLPILPASAEDVGPADAGGAHFSLDVRGHCELGLVRKTNQDSAYFSPSMLLVADGMGGAAAGDLASAVAVTEISKADRHFEGEAMLEAFAGAMHRANDQLAALVADDPDLDGMGTTVTGALFSGRQLGLVHLGDSRAYLFREGRLRRLTHDHSWVQSLVDEGRIDEDEAAIHPHRSLLLKVLNGQPHQPDLALVDLTAGDRLLFCSDGLAGFTTDVQIARSLNQPDLDDVMESLVGVAYHGGGADNITVLLADVVPQDDQLDARPPETLGAATTTPIPPLAGLAASAPAASEPAAAASPTQPAPAAKPDAEHLRYAPRFRHRRRWGIGLLVGLALILLLAGAGYGGWRWTRTQFYVGAVAGHVAIFQGIPQHVPGLSLATLLETEPTLVSDLPSYYRDKVDATIQVASVAAGRVTAAELAAKADACIAKRRAGGTGSSGPSASGSATRSASASSSHRPTPPQSSHSASATHSTTSAASAPRSSPGAVDTSTASASQSASSEDCS